jgi:hypothetical protein
MKPALSREYLQSILKYEPETGNFYWIRPHSGTQTEVAGSLSKEGYIRITIDGWRYMAHLLAWLWMTGEYLKKGLDHRDTVRSNNRWGNIRKATLSQNNMNANLRSDNELKAKGVHKRKDGGKKPYRAMITPPGGRQITIGHFTTLEEASLAYSTEAKKRFGEFARVL